jgi:hypothetical protein
VGETSGHKGRRRRSEKEKKKKKKKNNSDDENDTLRRFQGRDKGYYVPPEGRGRDVIPRS